jgi:hypothetical protein
MILLVFARNRLTAFHEELTRLEHSEFPYPAAEAALRKIKDVFVQHTKMLDMLDEESDLNTVKLQNIRHNECCAN